MRDFTKTVNIFLRIKYYVSIITPFLTELFGHINVYSLSFFDVFIEETTI